MSEQYKLTIYVGGPADDLPNHLIKVSEAVFASHIAIYWESGIDGVPGMGMGVRVEVTTDGKRVPATLDAIGEWFQESEVPTILVEIQPTFLRRVDRDS